MNKQRIFVIVSLLLILALTGGIIINQKLGKIAQNLNSQARITDADPENTEISPHPAEIGDSHVPPDEITDGQVPPSESEGSLRPADSTAKPNPEPGSVSGDAPILSRQEMIAAVQEQVDKPIEKKDIASVGIILLRRLSWEEINWVYRVMQDQKADKEEIDKVKDLLETRLTKEEIKSLKKIGSKYGL